MGGVRQRRLQGKKSDRENQKQTLDHIINTADLFLKIKDPRELMSLLGISIEDMLEIYQHSYENFYLAKKTGRRKISKPSKKLMRVQRELANFLNCVYKSYVYKITNSPSHSYIISTLDATTEINIVSNAKPHIGKSIIANIDIKDFFSSISKAWIIELFCSDPFNYTIDIATFLSDITTFEGTLPAGAPTSPILSNFIAKRIDDILINIPKITYTRYSDDITLSSNYYDKYEFDNLVKQVIKTIEYLGFHINSKKSKLSMSTERQKVTGIVVNKKTNVERSYIRQIRAILHSLEKDGIVQSSEIYANKNQEKYYKSIKSYFDTYLNWRLSNDFIRLHCDYGTVWYFIKSIRGKIRLV